MPLHYTLDLKQIDSNIDNRTLKTRSHQGIRLKTHKSSNTKYSRSINYRAIEAWNKLDVYLTIIESKSKFKDALKNSYSSPYIQDVMTN